MIERDELIRRLRDYLAGLDEVRTAYLFGSVARGENGPTSDVDVAVVLDPHRLPPGRSAGRRRLDLTVDLMALLGAPRVDLIPLDLADPLLAHRVLRDGILLKDADRAARIALEERILHRYVDTRPLREAQWQAFRGRLRRQGW